jgi:FKBP-type peptidyl-prolyl cis-trans isomerase FklB
MRNQLTSIALLAAAGLFLSGNANAQTSSTTPAPAPAAQSPSSSATPKPKTGTGTGPSAAKTGTAAAPLVLKTERDKASYAIGLNIGKTMQKDGVEVNTAIMARGVRDILTNAKVQMTDAEIEATLKALSAGLKAKQDAKLAAMSSGNKAAGAAFLAANKSKDGVVALPSGLQYKIITAGTGPKPTAADTVVCNYKGTLLNGKEFDSSYKRGQPATFPVGQVIKGWTEALQLMPVGSKWELYIPSDLAYGARQAGPDITPESTLVFEVELMSIQPKAAEAPKPDAANPDAPKTDAPKTDKPAGDAAKDKQPQ